MSADDQAFIDALSSVPNDIRRYSSDVADYVDKHLNHVSNILRETLLSSPWIPESARPRPPPPPPRSLIEKISPPPSMYGRVQNWVVNHKVLATVIVVAIGGATYQVIKRRSSRRKRRAKRAGNGARLEVVVIAGSPSEPLTRSISLDLERRGFIVYIVCNNIEEEKQVQGESRPDIKPLMIDIVDPNSARAAIDRFTAHLQSPHAAFQGARFHHLIFRSLIFIPTTTYPSSPIAALSPSTLSDLLNTRLLTPILTLQTFLPLLQNLPLHHPHLHSGPSTPIKPSILIMTPSIVSSLSPAFHLPESTIVSGLTSFTSVLTAELSPLDIPVTHLQLGTFDTRAYTPHNNKQLTIQGSRAETLRWDDEARSAYGKNFVHANAHSVKGPVVGHGTSLRNLNDAVFDAMIGSRGGTVRVGMGSSLYGFVGRFVPKDLVGYMMGMRAVGREKEEFGRSIPSSSRSTSPGSPGKEALEGSEYINVWGEAPGDNQV
ncbi:hypothetical protein BJ875DRAFT_271063 [Amylocarpus encephaloides]|uniref:DUF1776-domain-containing protein n=1 Tax=Amylocarpus encephaloides TaxID=45428 RepID=A0A9P8C7U0_9HELO|nr:hypothetical protein BJ875DRAFT_271063 [Amylocarpus encephaloides]